MKVGGEMPNIRFNHKNNPSYLLVHEINDSFLPSVDIRTMKVPGRAGEHRFSKNIGMREISVVMSIAGENERDVKNKARAVANFWLHTDSPAQFVNLDEPDIFYLAEVADAGKLAQKLSLGRATVTFLCPDPHAYRITESVVSLAALPASGAIEFINEGKDVFPRFRMTFTGDASHFSLVTENRRLTFGRPGGPVVFRNNDVLVIDGERGLILKGNERFYDALSPDSEFPKLHHGFNAVKFEQRASVRNVEMRLRKRWF